MQQDQKRLGNALVHIMNRCKNFGRTQLVKTIFFADLIHYNMCGTLMFPSTYKRLDHGPASDAVMNITAPVELAVLDDFLVGMVGIHSHFADQDITHQFFDTGTKEIGDCTRYTYTPKVNEDLSDIPAYQLEILDAATCLTQRLGSANGSSGFTHMFSLWNDVEPNTKIPEKLFQVNEKERFLLSHAGVYLTPFAREFYRDISTPATASELAGRLPKLSCSYPDDPWWDEGLDAYLAWDSAMMFCCKAAPDMLNDLCAKGLALVAGITCSGVNPDAFHKYATTCELECNQICERVALMDDTVLSDAEKDSVNSVMNAILCELRQNA